MLTRRQTMHTGTLVCIVADNDREFEYQWKRESWLERWMGRGYGASSKNRVGGRYTEARPSNVSRWYVTAEGMGRWQARTPTSAVLRPQRNTGVRPQTSWQTNQCGRLTQVLILYWLLDETYNVLA